MLRTRSILLFLTVALLALPAAASAARSTGAVVFSRVSGAVDSKEGAPKAAKGGLFAVRDGQLNQLTEDPSDAEPAFSPDGRTIAFARGGDIYSVRPDGSGQRHLTSGPEIDSAPIVSPNGRYVVFERRAAEGAQGDLYTVGAQGGGLHPLATSAEDEHDPDFSPDGKAIVFVRSTAEAGGTSDDLYSVRPGAGGARRLTSTAVDEFEPRWFAGGILYSRGESTAGPAAYADVYTMRSNGTKVKSLVAGVGSAYVEDVSPDGHAVIFRRDRGLWVKRIGPSRARKLTELPDGSQTNSVFSSDGRRVAAFVEAEGETRLVSIDVATGRSTDLAAGTDFAEGSGTEIGPVISWQPVPHVH